ncbi:UNVERIFIED_CONTAM: hypothetical protein ABID98_004307 [Brevibacillus sp. OAP136]
MKRGAVAAAVKAMMAVLFLFSVTNLHITNESRSVKSSRAAEKSAGISYQADVDIQPDRQLITGTLKVRFVPYDRENAYFHLYPNAFSDIRSLADPNWSYMLGKEMKPGSITVQKVLVNGKPVSSSFYKKDVTVLAVALGSQKLKLGQPIELALQFSEKVPFNNGRFSYNDDAIWLGNWLPILAVHDQRGWHLDPYYPMGDPFYSDVADYQVSVKLPVGYRVATSGDDSSAIITQTRPAKSITYQIQAPRMRDFAMVVMSNMYEPLMTTVGNTRVTTWHEVGDNEVLVKKLHQTAVESFRYYSEQFGTYPYPEFDVVKTGGFFGGMEYPGIVFIQGEYYCDPLPNAAAVIAHETAHQWFYGLVGNDEVQEAWVDESLTDYAAMSYLKEREPREAGSYIAYRKQQSDQSVQYRSEGLTVWQPVNGFPNWDSYADLVYSRGAMMLWNLREQWGGSRVNHALKEYVAEYRFSQASGEDIIAAFTREAGIDATPYFAYWLRFDLDQQKQAAFWLERGKNKLAIK